MWQRRVRNSLIVAALCLLSAGSGHGRELSGDLRWSGRVELDEAVVVARGATLTIAAGTQVVAANPQVRISVHGLLQVAGTAAAPVSFAGPAGWQGLEFMEAPAGSVIRGAQFSAAKAAISSFTTDFRVEDCRFTGNEAAISLVRESSPVIVNSLFENNQVGIANEMKSAPQIRGNRFIGQTRAAILASHNSKGEIADNAFTGNKQGVALMQRYPDRIGGNRFIDNEVAIYCNQTQSTPLIEDNLFEGNGYGVLNFSFAYPVIRHNRFIANTTAVHNDQYGSPLVENNLFSDNETALYNYRKSNPQVRLNSFEGNLLALFCDFSAYPEVKQNNFLGNAMGVKFGIYQSADWEQRSGSKAIMQREAANRKSQNPLLGKAPDTFNDFVDVSGNWWGDDTAQLAGIGGDGNSPLFHDWHDQPEVTYEDYGPGVYRLDRVRFAPWLHGPVDGAGPLEKP